MALRWFLLNTQYRQPVNYSNQALDEVCLFVCLFVYTVYMPIVFNVVSNGVEPAPPTQAPTLSYPHHLSSTTPTTPTGI